MCIQIAHYTASLCLHHHIFLTQQILLREIMKSSIFLSVTARSCLKSPISENNVSTEL